MGHHTQRCSCVGFYCGGSFSACALHPTPRANIHSPVVQTTGHHQEQGRPWHVALGLGGSKAATEVHEEDEEEGDVPVTERQQLTGLARGHSPPPFHWSPALSLSVSPSWHVMFYIQSFPPWELEWEEQRQKGDSHSVPGACVKTEVKGWVPWQPPPAWLPSLHLVPALSFGPHGDEGMRASVSSMSLKYQQV